MDGVQINKEAWEAGYLAGYVNLQNRTPKEYDEYSWSSGYVEGKGDRKIGREAQIKPPKQYLAMHQNKELER